MSGAAAPFRVARASRVLAMASSPSRTSIFRWISRGAERRAKVHFCETQKPAGETPALPRVRISAFTIIELLIVMSIIIVLAGLVLATSGYVQEKGARSRTEAEIAAMSAALESYKADNGIYPTNSDTETLAANRDGDATAANYENGSLYLYKELSGDTNGTRAGTGKSYMPFKPNMLKPPPPLVAAVTAIRDPFGYSYGYSTIKAKTPAGNDGYNPTFDLWSTAKNSNQAKWIKNW